MCLYVWEADYFVLCIRTWNGLNSCVCGCVKGKVGKENLDKFRVLTATIEFWNLFIGMRSIIIDSKCLNL